MRLFKPAPLKSRLTLAVPDEGRYGDIGRWILISSLSFLIGGQYVNHDKKSGLLAWFWRVKNTTV